MDNFDVFSPTLPKNKFYGQIFENLRLGISISKILCVSFFIQNGELWIFGLKFGKLPNCVRYFGSNNVERVAESWMEAKVSWVEVGRGGWMWLDVDGAGWGLVHGSAIPVFFVFCYLLAILLYYFSFEDSMKLFKRSWRAFKRRCQWESLPFWQKHLYSIVFYSISNLILSLNIIPIIIHNFFMWNIIIKIV